jgi:hypothetical protein
MMENTPSAAQNTTKRYIGFSLKRNIPDPLGFFPKVSIVSSVSLTRHFSEKKTVKNTTLNAPCNLVNLHDVINRPCQTAAIKRTGVEKFAKHNIDSGNAHCTTSLANITFG